MREPSLLEKPTQFPYMCAGCRAVENTGRKYFIDTGVWTDFDGVIYFCDACFKTISLKIPDVVLRIDMEKREAELLKEFEVQSDKIRKYDEVMETLEKAGIDYGKLRESYFRKRRSASPTSSDGAEQLSEAASAEPNDHVERIERDDQIVSIPKIFSS